MQGIEKQIDELGRVVLPMEIRKKLGLKSKASLIVSMEGETILMTAVENCCALCGTFCDVHKNVRLCASCIASVKQME